MEQFTLDKIKNYKMFYVLKKIKSTSQEIVLLHKQSQEMVVVETEKYDLFQVGADQVLVAFVDVFQHAGKHNYVASDGLLEENILLNPYERIVDYYKTDRDDEPSGVFLFLNSCPAVLEGQDWRCDNALFGPRGFFPVGQEEKRLIDGITKIKVYEPVLSINGVGHIVYFKHEGDDTELRFDYINNAELPQSAETFSEMIKLILEWAKVSEEPFNNTEQIAIKAKQFVDNFGISESFVADQPSMQVVKYLQGDTLARVRTHGTYKISDAINSLVVDNLPYMTFSKIAELNPTMFNLKECLETEIQWSQEEWDQALVTHNITEPKEYGDVDGVCEHILSTFPNNLTFPKIVFGLLKKKKELLEEAFNSPSLMVD
jgi:hypothetical protein